MCLDPVLSEQGPDQASTSLNCPLPQPTGVLPWGEESERLCFCSQEMHVEVAQSLCSRLGNDRHSVEPLSEHQRGLAPGCAASWSCLAPTPAGGQGPAGCPPPAALPGTLPGHWHLHPSPNHGGRGKVGVNQVSLNARNMTL